MRGHAGHALSLEAALWQTLETAFLPNGGKKAALQQTLETAFAEEKTGEQAAATAAPASGGAPASKPSHAKSHGKSGGAPPPKATPGKGDAGGDSEVKAGEGKKEGKGNEEETGDAASAIMAAFMPKEGKKAPKAPEGKKYKAIVCGVSAADGQKDGRITCGVPLAKDASTGSQYIVPLYSQPTRNQAEAKAARPDPLVVEEAKASIGLRKEAMGLLKDFLDAAPSPRKAAAGFL
eukprot:TRINITY_DN54512_c0_g1_i1.p1 TRINITY_DN54512_c0_g1~~TRINITY_DN54512_c0_g1_i1.p1  ORF type:complete len:235 (-),score=75.83 TRINITY_DN54512_c0_g1_i1:32-736(-)